MCNRSIARTGFHRRLTRRRAIGKSKMSKHDMDMQNTHVRNHHDLATLGRKKRKNSGTYNLKGGKGKRGRKKKKGKKRRNNKNKTGGGGEYSKKGEDGVHDHGENLEKMAKMMKRSWRIW